MCWTPGRQRVDVGKALPVMDGWGRTGGGRFHPLRGWPKGELKGRPALGSCGQETETLLDRVSHAKDLGLDPKGTRWLVRGYYQA